MLFEIRKTVVLVEEIIHEFGPPPPHPVRKGAIAVVVSNPYVGEYVADFSPASDELQLLGEQL